MGSSLANATVANSYQCLFKVGDNTPLSSTLKRMSDGDGNDAPLWMSSKFITNNGTGTGHSNSVFGDKVLGSNTTGYSNTAIGYEALMANTTGSGNIVLGQSLLSNTIGANNIAIGNACLEVNSSGNGNIAIGGAALNDHTNGEYNTAIGFGALEQITSGNYNIAIGQNNSSAGFSNCLIFGSGVATADNQMVIGSDFPGLNIGSVTTETVPSTRTWSVKINGIDRKFLLA